MRWFNRGHAEDFAEAIRPELQALDVPAPRDDLMSRIISSRESGTRVILPDVPVAQSNASRRLLIPAAIVAAALLLVLPFRWAPQPEGASDASSFARIASEWLPGSVAFAQSDASRTVRGFAPMTLSRPGNLKPMRLEYLRSWRDSTGKETGRVTGVLTVERSTTQGVPSWLVVARNQGSRDGRMVLAIDSTTIARENLALLSHTAIERPYSRYEVIRIDQRFRGDSILGQMHATGAGVSPAWRPIARRLSAQNGPFILDPLAPVILGAVRVHAGWSGRASLVGWAVRDDDVLMPIDLRVDGSEKIKVPAGEFDCWKLTINFGGRSLAYWVRKSDGVGVRSVERNASGMTRETKLIRF